MRLGRLKWAVALIAMGLSAIYVYLPCQYLKLSLPRNTRTLIHRSEIGGTSQNPGHKSRPSIKPKVILFTTFSNRSEKLFVYGNTIRNWASFLPHIQPVLFTTFPHGPVVDLARKHAWLVAPNPTVNIFGSPVLKDMYLAAIANTRLFGEATLYGYANGDILFDSGLNETLTKVIENIGVLNTTLVFGIRRNYQLLSESNYTNDPLWPPQKIAQLGHNNYSKLFRYDAFDYFFVTRDFPFGRFLPLVIGRSGFDTYFTAMALVSNLTTIEGTGTITALHQTDQDGNFAHNKPMNNTDKSYNRILLGTYKLSPGYASRAIYGSIRNKDGTVFLRCRHSRQCKRRKKTTEEGRKVKGMKQV